MELEAQVLQTRGMNVAEQFESFIAAAAPNVKKTVWRDGSVTLLNVWFAV